MPRILLVCLAALTLACSVMAQSPASGKRVRRLLIHNAIVVDGNGTPASGNNARFLGRKRSWDACAPGSPRT